MGIDPAEIFAVATANRLLAADVFAGLTDEQWRTPSLCAGWTVREVAAHLVPPAGGFTTWRLAGQVIRFRGNLDRMVDVTAREGARRPVGDLVADLRARAAMRLSPPIVGPAGPMTDTAIHLRDAARPLGLDVNPEPGAWRPVLDFLVSRPATRGFIPAGRLSGLRLEAADQWWSWGPVSWSAGRARRSRSPWPAAPSPWPTSTVPGLRCSQSGQLSVSRRPS